ncbi:MAG TPA: AlkA N-terminal domain-containing protein [Candidatus Polarisedimenticolaceae bacterium]|nr:AlkA N-terminal domain-containing protein [Candidatus Polarisedimenticolaceae bacterium]
MLAFLAARAVEGVERVEHGRYRRTLPVGWIEVAHLPEASSLLVTGTDPAAEAGRVGALFGLEADPEATGAHLARDPLLAPLVAARPGLRVPGGWDGFEVAMRAVLGQQVSVAAARRLLGSLVRLCGGAGFPTPGRVHEADLSLLGMPGARRVTLRAVARAALDDPLLFTRKGSVEETVARLREIPGVGEWTAQYIALRAAREPDAFPASDLGLLRGAAGQGARPTPAQLLARAERWRPYRAYAAQHLWTEDAARMRP